MSSAQNKDQNLVYNIKYSSVVPASVTEKETIKEFTFMDLTMKLHYIRGVYFFKRSAVEELNMKKIKEPMFLLLDLCNITSGRVRRSEETGKPFIKCDDCGVRIIEAQTDKTIDEWLQMKDISNSNHYLAFDQVLGPKLRFSPLVFIQFTWFRCGGLSIGLSWAHALGDALAASNFIYLWGLGMAGSLSTKSMEMPPKSDIQTTKGKTSNAAEKELVSVRKVVEPVGDHWVVANNCKMETFSFQISASQLDHLQSKISYVQTQTKKVPTFEAISAIIWQCITKVSENQEPRIITICRNGSQRENKIVGNNQVLSVVKSEFSIVEANISELAATITKKCVEENELIEKVVQNDLQGVDFLVYGTNLTFVDLEEIELYELKLNGQKPVFANYTIHGVSKEGVVLVLPGKESVEEDGSRGRTVTVTLQENQVTKLREELQKEWCIV